MQMKCSVGFALVSTVVLPVGALVFGGGLSGCAASGGGKAKVVAEATPAQRAALLGAVKGLEGAWEMKSPDGASGEIVFKTSSAGSVVREVMFPGSPHEMTNMYHMDGPSLVMTHFCAAGNQPRMRAVANRDGVIEFKTDGVSNLTGSDEHYMAEMTLTIVSADEILEDWRSIEGAKMSEKHASFKLTRKK